MDDDTDISQAYKLYITIGVLMFFLVATTSLRILTRLRYAGRLTADDYFILLGTAFNIIANGMEIFAVTKGFGRHSHFLEEGDLITALKYCQLGVVMAILAICSIKISVCLFLLGLVRDIHRRFIQFLWALMAFTTVTSFVALVLWGTQANPIEKLWDPRVKGTRRSSHDFLNVVFVWNTFNLITDLIYSFAPVWFLWNTNISKRNKYSIYGIMGSALVLVAVVVLCFIFAPEFLQTEDITWALVPEFLADCTQRQLSGIIANLPALFMLFRRQRKQSSSNQQCRGSPVKDNFIPGSWVQRIVRKSEIKIEDQSDSSKGKNKDPYRITDAAEEDELPLKMKRNPLAARKPKTDV